MIGILKNTDDKLEDLSLSVSNISSALCCYLSRTILHIFHILSDKSLSSPSPLPLALHVKIYHYCNYVIQQTSDIYLYRHAVHEHTASTQ